MPFINTSAKHLQKANRLLDRAQELVAAGLSSEAALDAYLVVYHSTRASIIANSRSSVRAPVRVHAEFARLTILKPHLPDAMQRFISQTMKGVACAATIKVRGQRQSG
ncbi:MAG: hypothetical protein ACLP7P_02265 [Rhodomicrobium sp.]